MKFTNDLINKYLKGSNWRLRENANTNESFSNMQNFIASNILANDFLSSLPYKHRKAHQDALIHIHNLESGGYVPYCAGHSLKLLIMNGMKTFTINSRPAKHLNSITDQVMNWLYCAQMEFAGAQAFSNFDVLIAPFIKKDNLPYSEVKQQIQKLIYNLNMTMRSSSQTPFSNLSLDYSVPRFLENEEAIVGGNLTGFKYSDCLDEISMIDRVISELMMEKDPNGIPFTFPILSINLTKKFDWDSEASRLMAENANKVGSYYWMSYLGSDIDEDSIRSLCCRLSLDMKELSGPTGLWNTAEGTGSLGVVTINFPRLGFDCRGKDEDIFFEKLRERLEIAISILNFRKERIKKYQDRMMPVNLLNGWSMKNYFITIGVIGFNELCLNYLGTDIIQNIPFIEKVMKFLRKWIKEKQMETKQLINIEIIPGEGSSYRLAYVDRKLNPGIITLGTKSAPYYTSLLIPASSDIDLFERLKLEEKILPLFTGGTIFRVFTGEKEVDTDIVLDLIKKISSTKIPYFDLTNTFSVCKKEAKTFRGAKQKCPECNGETEVYSRVVGYYRDIKKWNIGKVEEFHNRKYVNL
uniref:Putative anaerobic ribonucleoside-triphosphate reductase n=1 Tax=viral metagenome TaxID=1070528 RepID=A0A6M3XQ27_9ZZZZ